MGFTPKRKTYRLTFADSDLEGLVVTAGSVSTGQLLEIQELHSAATGGGDEDAGRASTAFRDMVTMFAGALVEWNLEDEDGAEVKPTLDGLLDQEPSLVLAVVQAWSQAIAGVSAPLAGGSPSGGPSLEASLPMEPVSESPAS